MLLRWNIKEPWEYLIVCWSEPRLHLANNLQQDKGCVSQVSNLEANCWTFSLNTKFETLYQTSRAMQPFSTQFDFNFNQELRFLSAFNFHLNVILRKTMFKPQFLMNVNVYETYSLTDF